MHIYAYLCMYFPRLCRYVCVHYRVSPNKVGGSMWIRSLFKGRSFRSEDVQ